MPTTGDCGNLLVTKAIIRRFFWAALYPVNFTLAAASNHSPTGHRINTSP